MGMEKNIGTLTERLEFTTAELDVMDSVLHQANLEDTPRRLSQTQGPVIGSTPLNAADRIGHLKDELYRALANVKSKRDEIRKLSQNLEERNNEIRYLKDAENRYLVEIEQLKEDKIRLENRLKNMEEDKANNLSSNAMTNESLQNLKTQLEQIQTEKSELEAKCVSQENERKRLDVQLKNVEVDLEELKQEHENMKRNYEQMLEENKQLRQRHTADNLRLELEKHKFLLKDAQAECDRLKNLYIEISNAKEALCYEIESLRKSDSNKELQEQKEKVASLQRALQLAEVKSTELTKILETEKLCHEKDIKELRERLEKEKAEHNAKAVKEAENNCSKCLDYVAEITKVIRFFLS